MARILVIDDTKNIRKMVRLVLEREGHEIEVAEDGIAGLKSFGDGSRWDLVLLDERMPGSEGHEVLREIKARRPAMRVVMITSFATVELAADVVAAGVVDFLRKPFTAEVLRGTVQTALADKPVEQARTAVGAPFPYAINGFQFWQVELQASDIPTPALEVRRAFAVRDVHDVRRCIVGVTPHACRLARDELRGTPGDEVWDVLCRSALSNFLWERAELPPAVLPIFELSSNQVYDLNSLANVDAF